MSAVLAPFVAAATEEEVGCLWSLGQGARRLVGVLSALQCPTVSVPGGMENWKAESVLLGSLCTFRGLGPGQRPVCPRCFRRLASSGLPRKWFQSGTDQPSICGLPRRPCLGGEQWLASGLGPLTRLTSARAGPWRRLREPSTKKPSTVPTIPTSFLLQPKTQSLRSSRHSPLCVSGHGWAASLGRGSSNPLYE